MGCLQSLLLTRNRGATASRSVPAEQLLSTCAKKKGEEQSVEIALPLFDVNRRLAFLLARRREDGNGQAHRILLSRLTERHLVEIASASIGALSCRKV